MYGWKTEDKYIPNKGEERGVRSQVKGAWKKGEEKEEKAVDKGLYKRKKKLIVALANSFLSNEPSLREKTWKFVYLLRSLSIYRVDKVIFYDARDKNGCHKDSDKEMIRKIHRYYLTPPYLRRKVIPLDPYLRFVGSSPPLRLLIHSVSSKVVRGEYRQALVLNVGKGFFEADIGLRDIVKVKCVSSCPSEGGIVLVFVSNTDPLEVIYDKSFSRKIYVGPELGFVDNLLRLIKFFKKRNYYIIATSRYGTSITLTILNEITDKLYSKKGVFILFGSPYTGLFDIASKYRFKLEDWVDIVLNTLPNQGTKTVRTEEAVHATLTLLNIMI